MKLGLIHIDEWPMGKHKGKAMHEMPTEYLTWVVYTSDMGGIPLKWALAELDKREGVLRDLGSVKDVGVDVNQIINEDDW